MQTVERHPVSFDARVQAAYKMQLGSLPRVVARAPAHPDVLATLMDICQVLLPYGLGLGAPQEERDRVLRLGSQAGAALFTAAATTSGTVRVPLDGSLADIRVTGPTSATHPGRWEDAFAFAAVARDADALDLLCRVPVSLLEAGGTKSDAFLSRWVEALVALWCRQPVGPAVAAMRAAAGSANSALPGAVAAIVAQGDLALAVEASDEAAVNTALHAALSAHRAFWGAADRAKLPKGLLAWTPLALAVLARDRGVTLLIQSDYLPAALLGA